MSTSVAERTGLRGLRDSLDGDLMTPGTPGYDAARSVWNGMIDRCPAVVIQANSTSDVQRAVAFARE
jgi:hypothetical protein